MPGPKFFPDEIADRLRDLSHDDIVIVCKDFRQKNYYCRQTARNEDGIYSTYRHFETKYGIVVDNIIMRLYDALEDGAHLYVVINGKREPF